VVEGAPLLREYTSKGYRGFESHPLRQTFKNYRPPPTGTHRKTCLYWRIVEAGLLTLITARDGDFTSSSAVFLQGC
jgi:hypothetical protein